jgi:hypothetical protein
VIWEIFADPRRLPRGLAFAVSRDRGSTFSAPAQVPGSADPAGGWNGSLQGMTRKIAVNSAGAVAVVNSSFLPGVGSRVWLMRGSL